MVFEFNDLKGFMFLVLSVIPLTTSTNINCHGKPFHCLNSSHFMICVDLGNGVTSTIDDFVIPCPPTTMCHESNRYECEFFQTVFPTTPPDVIDVSAVDINVFSSINKNITSEAEIATVTPLTENNKTDVQAVAELTSPTKIEILESLKEEFTDGNEKAFQDTVTETTTISSLHQKEVVPTNSNTNRTISNSNINLNIESTSESAVNNNNNVLFVTDHPKSIVTATSVDGLLTVRTTNIEKMNTTNAEFIALEPPLTKIPLDVMITTVPPFTSIHQNFDLDKSPNNTSSSSKTVNFKQFENNLTTKEPVSDHVHIPIGTTVNMTSMTTNDTLPLTVEDTTPKNMFIDTYTTAAVNINTNTEKPSKVKERKEVLHNKSKVEEQYTTNLSSEIPPLNSSVARSSNLSSIDIIKRDNAESTINLTLSNPIKSLDTNYSTVSTDSVNNQVTESTTPPLYDNATHVILTITQKDKSTKVVNKSLSTVPLNTTNIDFNIRDNIDIQNYATINVSTNSTNEDPSTRNISLHKEDNKKKINASINNTRGVDNTTSKIINITISGYQHISNKSHEQVEASFNVISEQNNEKNIPTTKHFNNKYITEISSTLNDDDVLKAATTSKSVNINDIYTSTSNSLDEIVLTTDSANYEQTTPVYVTTATTHAIDVSSTFNESTHTATETEMTTVLSLNKKKTTTELPIFHRTEIPKTKLKILKHIKEEFTEENEKFLDKDMIVTTTTTNPLYQKHNVIEQQDPDSDITVVNQISEKMTSFAPNNFTFNIVNVTTDAELTMTTPSTDYTKYETKFEAIETIMPITLDNIPSSSIKDYATQSEITESVTHTSQLVGKSNSDKEHKKEDKKDKKMHKVQEILAEDENYFTTEKQISTRFGTEPRKVVKIKEKELDSEKHNITTKPRSTKELKSENVMDFTSIERTGVKESRTEKPKIKHFVPTEWGNFDVDKAEVMLSSIISTDATSTAATENITIHPSANTKLSDLQVILTDSSLFFEDTTEAQLSQANEIKIESVTVPTTTNSESSYLQSNSEIRLAPRLTTADLNNIKTTVANSTKITTDLTNSNVPSSSLINKSNTDQIEDINGTQMVREYSSIPKNISEKRNQSVVMNKLTNNRENNVKQDNIAIATAKSTIPVSHLKQTIKSVEGTEAISLTKTSTENPFVAATEILNIKVTTVRASKEEYYNFKDGPLLTGSVNQEKNTPTSRIVNEIVRDNSKFDYLNETETNVYHGTPSEVSTESVLKYISEKYVDTSVTQTTRAQHSTTEIMAKEIIHDNKFVKLPEIKAADKAVTTSLSDGNEANNLYSVNKNAILPVLTTTKTTVEQNQNELTTILPDILISTDKPDIYQPSKQIPARNSLSKKKSVHNNTGQINFEVPSKTITDPSSKVSSTIETVFIIDNKTTDTFIIGDTIFTENTFSNKPINVTNQSHEHITTDKAAMINTTPNFHKSNNFNKKEDLNIVTENNTLTMKQINVNGIDIKNNNFSSQGKNKSSTTYVDVASQTKITTSKPLFDNENNKSVNKMATISLVTAGETNFNLLHMEKQTPPSSYFSESKKSQIGENSTKYGYSSVNISINLSDTDNSHANNSRKSEISKTNVEADANKNKTENKNTFNSNIKRHIDSLDSSSQSLAHDNSGKPSLTGLHTTTFNITNFRSEFDCTNRTRGKYADNNDCRKFYICLGNLQPIAGTCPNNTVFSEINKQCTRNLSHCVRNNQFHCLYEGRFSDFLKVNIYYICVKHHSHGFLRFKLQCQDGYSLNKSTIKCVLNEGASSQSISSVSENSQTNDQTEVKVKSEEVEKLQNDFTCEKEGKFPYEDDCTKYYECKKTRKNEYRRKIKKCSDDKVYNKKKSKCKSNESSEC